MRKAAEVASQWWSEVVGNPKFDNGDNSVVGLLVNASNTSNVEFVTEEQVVRFRECLAQLVDAEFEKGLACILTVDYSPNLHLQKAAKECGISQNNFPHKTTMWVYEGYVSVSYGYGADEEILYETVEHWEDMIKSVSATMESFNDPEDAKLLNHFRGKKEEYENRLSELKSSK